MYYKVLCDGKAYYSKEIVKAYLHIGDDKVQRDVLSGTLVMRELMDRMVYELPAKSHAEIDAQFAPVVQDMSAQTRGFIRLQLSLRSAELQNAVVITVDPKAPRYDFAGYSFVRFNAVRSRSKYREQAHLPVIEVCGMKYVALNCFKDSSETMFAR